MSAATVILMQMRRIVRQFRDAGATHATAAIVPSQHGIRESFAFSRLVNRGVLVAVNSKRFYLDEEAEAKFRRQRQRLVVVLVAMIIVGIIVSLLVAK
ncbi:MAG: hypothetical protein EOO10_07345 [Chitinophagaceae bacterium]|nr:MAG: hypothetical protein EOO10_07345 [Chitinophagaceae bacterium]